MTMTKVEEMQFRELLIKKYEEALSRFQIARRAVSDARLLGDELREQIEFLKWQIGHEEAKEKLENEQREKLGSDASPQRRDEQGG